MSAASEDPTGVLGGSIEASSEEVEELARLGAASTGMLSFTSEVKEVAQQRQDMLDDIEYRKSQEESPCARLGEATQHPTQSTNPSSKLNTSATIPAPPSPYDARLIKHLTERQGRMQFLLEKSQAETGLEKALHDLTKQRQKRKIARMQRRLDNRKLKAAHRELNTARMERRALLAERENIDLRVQAQIGAVAVQILSSRVIEVAFEVAVAYFAGKVVSFVDGGLGRGVAALLRR